MVALKMLVTSGMQPPHPVPALVHALTSPILLHVPFFTLAVTSTLVTLWHEQICVSSSLYIVLVCLYRREIRDHSYSSSGLSSSPSFLAPKIKELGGTSIGFLFLTIATSFT